MSKCICTMTEAEWKHWIQTGSGGRMSPDCPLHGIPGFAAVPPDVRRRELDEILPFWANKILLDLRRKDFFGKTELVWERGAVVRINESRVHKPGD